MRAITTMGRATLVLACSAVFAGAAFAGDKPKDDAPGNSGNAPGQQQQAEQPKPDEQKTPPGQAKKAEKQAAKADTKAAKQSAKGKSDKAKGAGSYKATSSGTDLKKGMDHKHTICHATGSSSNPFVVITPSVSGVFNGHLGHQGGEDIVPPFTYKGQTYSQNWDAEGQALFANGCRPAASVAQTTTQTTTTTPTTTTTLTAADCPPVTRTVTDVVPGGVFHATGSKTNPYVFIRPSKGSAHYTKHANDMIVPDETVTRTIVVSAGSCEPTTTTVAGLTSTVTLAGETVTVPGSTVTVPGSTVTVAGSTATVGSETTTTEEAGGVLGAQSPPGAGGAGAGGEAGAGDEDAGGVLGAVASLGETATSGTLPFTGIPLWLAALVGTALIAAGLTLRRTT